MGIFTSCRAVAAIAALGCAAAWAQAPQGEPVQRLRGTIEKVDANSLTLKERSGETLTLAYAPDFSVIEVVPIELSAIAPGSFIGTAARPQADGTLRAIEVTVFPEAMRGVGEGHRAWDLEPGSTMTNATVEGLASAPEGRKLTLRYKDGEKTVVVPPDVPVVTLRPGDRSLLVPGARIGLSAQMRNGQPTALRAQAGRNGFGPPM